MSPYQSFPANETPYRVVMVTCETQDEAERLANTLVDEKLAACVNQIGPITSTYFWEEETVRSLEYLLLIKTTETVLAKLTDRVRTLHSYTEPEVISLPILGGSSTYLNWLAQNVHL